MSGLNYYINKGGFVTFESWEEASVMLVTHTVCIGW